MGEIIMKRIIVRNSWLKFALCFAAIICMFLLDLLLAAAGLSDQLMQALPGVIMVLVLYGLSRIFRSQGEPDTPRPFWQMTNSKLASWLCAVLLLLSSYRTAFSDGQAPAIYFPAAAYLVLAVFFIISAIKAQDFSS